MCDHLMFPGCLNSPVAELWFLFSNYYWGRAVGVSPVYFLFWKSFLEHCLSVDFGWYSDEVCDSLSILFSITKRLRYTVLCQKTCPVILYLQTRSLLVDGPFYCLRCLTGWLRSWVSLPFGEKQENWCNV